MDARERPRWHQRLDTRLALWYGLILVSVLSLASLAFYGAMIGVMRRHADAQLMAHAAETDDLLEEGGVHAVEHAFARMTRIAGARDLFLVLRDPEGNVAASSDLAEWHGFPTDWPGASGKMPLFDYRSGPGGHHDHVRVARIPLGRRFVLEEGISTQNDFRVIQNTRVIVAIILACVAVLALVFGLATTRRAVAGMMRVTEAASDIARSAALNLRVPVPDRPDEVSWQARTFNAMLDRIERIVGDMRATNDNIAHELRSPVACIRGSAESALMAPHTAEEYQAVLASTVEECDRLLEIINTMLDIADTNAGVGLENVGETDLAELAGWACDLFAPVAEEKDVSLALDCASPLPVRGDLARLRRCAANLVDNAIKYSPPGRTVSVSAGREGNLSFLCVANDCAGMPGDLDRLFNRFHRGPNAKGMPGNGLGLSLARSIARAHGGDIKAEMEGDQRIVFTLRL